MVSGLRLSTLVLSACIAFGFVAIARAESAAVLPHAGDTRLEPARAAAHRAVIDALREQGLQVRALTTKASKNLAELHSDCTQVSCAPSILAAHGIDLAVAVAVWNGEDGPQTNVTLIDALGRKYPGYAIVVGDDAAAAGRAALLEARSLHLLGPGPWIHVRGAPVGAAVMLDDKPVGILPYRGAISPGDHQLEVRADGYGAKRQPIVIPLEPTTTARIELELAPDSSAAPSSPTESTAPLTDDYVQDDPARATADRASPWNYVIGGVVAAGGLALATIEPIQTISKDGDCANDACSERYATGGETALKIGAGVLLAAAGVTIMIWQPLRVEADIGEDHAVIRGHLSF
jgi:hypothetical protein